MPVTTYPDRRRPRRRNRSGTEHTITRGQYMANPKNHVAQHGGTRAWRGNRAKGTFGVAALRDGRR